MNVTELKAALDAAGITYPANANKAELELLLNPQTSSSSSTIAANPPKITTIRGEVVGFTDMDDYSRCEVETLDGERHVINIPFNFQKKAKTESWLNLDVPVVAKIETRIKNVTTYESNGVVKLHSGMTNDTSEVFGGISRMGKRRWEEMIGDYKREKNSRLDTRGMTDVKALIEEVGSEAALTIHQILALKR